MIIVRTINCRRMSSMRFIISRVITISAIFADSTIRNCQDARQWTVRMSWPTTEKSSPIWRRQIATPIVRVMHVKLGIRRCSCTTTHAMLIKCQRVSSKPCTSTRKNAKHIFATRRRRCLRSICRCARRAQHRELSRRRPSLCLVLLGLRRTS